jgi:broad specificity phosphatase PhoE
VHTVSVEPRLQEVSTGEWDGLTHEDIEAGWPGALHGTDHYNWYFRSPDGETLDAALERIRSWLNEGARAGSGDLSWPTWAPRSRRLAGLVG